MREVVIVIPVYKENLTENQRISISQCFQILGAYDIKLVCPVSFNPQEFQAIADQFSIGLDVRFIERHYFQDIWSYNQLLTSPHFFRQFDDYRFMLIYQNDAFVFRDELTDWCNSGYDYLGAPWFEGYTHATIHSAIIGAGNGGFSLRNIQKSIFVLETVYRLRSILKRLLNIRILQRWNYKSISKLLALFYKLKISDISELISFDKQNFRIDYSNLNEDVFWADTVPAYFNDFTSAPPEIAMNFSFENNPSLLYQMTGFRLPFGCHAWDKYDPEFWAEHINLAYTK